MKKLGLAVLLVVLVFSMAGCGASKEDMARKDLESYLKAKKEGDSSKAEKYLDADSDLYDVYDYKYISILKSDSDMKNGDYFTFLYDMHIATEGGNEIHRKIEFEMIPSSVKDPAYYLDHIKIRENYDSNNDN